MGKRKKRKGLVGILKSKIGIKKKPKKVARDIQEIEDKFKEKLKEMFQNQCDKIKEWIATADLSAFSKIEKADDTDDFMNMVNSDGFKEQFPQLWKELSSFMTPSELSVIMYEMMVSGIEFGLVDALTSVPGLEKKISFNLYDKRVSDFLDNYTFKASQKTIDRLTGDVLGAIKEGQESGMSIPQIQDLMDEVFANMKDYETERIARTETIKSSNAGRFEAYQSGGVPEKVWLGDDDGRERESHIALNYEIVPIDQPFSNGLMYPGDPDGEAKEVINCRCAIGAIYPENRDRYVKLYQQKK